MIKIEKKKKKEEEEEEEEVSYEPREL